MNRIRKIRKNKETTKKNIKKIKSLSLKIALIMLNFIFATFAWFIYENTLDTTVDVKVSAWKVDFKKDNTSLETAVQFEVEKLYPGMSDYVKTIDIENLGDRAATIEYTIDELKILGTTYEIKQTPEAGDSENTVYYSQTEVNGKVIVKLLNDSSKFPFEITLTHSKEINTKSDQNATAHKGIFEVKVSWPYEITGTEEEIAAKNTLDTSWGLDIANFYKNLPEGDTTHGIEITMQAIAKQIID